MNYIYARMFNVAYLRTKEQHYEQEYMDCRVHTFAMFFGAGNLIFPTNLGLDSGHFFWPAILAFALTGIGLPLLGVVVGALDKQGYIGAFNKISPVFR